MALNTQIEEVSPSFHIDCDRALFLAVLLIHVDMEDRGTRVLVVVSFPLFKHYHHTNIFIFTSRKAARSYVTVGPGKRYDLLFLTMLTSILECQEPFKSFLTVLIFLKVSTQWIEGFFNHLASTAHAIVAKLPLKYPSTTFVKAKS